MYLRRSNTMYKTVILLMILLIVGLKRPIDVVYGGFEASDIPLLRIGQDDGEYYPLDEYFIASSLQSIPSPISGVLNVLVVPTRFSNYGNLTSIDSILDKVASVNNYFIEVSYNNIQLYIQYFTSWIDLPNTREFYGADSAGTIDVNIDQYITDTLDAIDPVVNLTQFDYIIMVHVGYDQASSGDPYDIWSAATLGKWFFSGYDGGVYLGIAILAETDPYGVFAHELGHNMELLDLYDKTGANEFVGRWSLMDVGSWFIPPPSIMAVEKKWLGWIQPQNIVVVPRDEYRVLTLNPLDTSLGTLMAEIPLSSIYYTVEYRRRVGTDSSLPDDGVIIARVDESRGSGQGPIIVVDANPGTASKSDAAFKQGMIYVDMAADFYVRILSLSFTEARVYIQNGIPNLYIVNYSYTSNDTEYTFSVDIGNSGGAAPNVSVSMYVNGEFKYIWRANSDVRKGDVVRVTFPPVKLPVGNHSILFVVDDGNNILERNENDNTLNVSVSVNPLYVLDRYVVSRPRADVNTIQTIYIHFSDYSTRLDYANQMVYINNTGYTTNSTGWIQLNVFSPSVGRIIYVLTDPKGVQLTTPQIIFDKVIVNLTIGDPDGRVDVGSQAPIVAIARYAYDGAIFNGSLIFNEDLIKNVVGRFTYTVIAIQDNLYGLTAFESNSVDIIFDRIVININYDDRVGVGTDPIINITAYYEYDGTPFTGGILFNDTVVKNVVGRFGFRVVEVQDNLYGITVYTANEFSVIYDKVIILLSADRERFDVGTQASISITAFYLYDGGDYDGYILLNDSLVKDEVGRYGYSVAAIGNDTYGITVFESNEISIIFDRVVVNLSVEDDRINVGARASISWKGYYEFDGAIFNGSISLNGSLVQDRVGRYTYVVISISDPLYGLKVFKSNTVSVVFDRVVIELRVVDDRVDVGSTVEISISAWYEYDMTNYDGYILLNDSLKKDVVGRYFYVVAEIGNDSHGITVFRSNVVFVIFDKVVIELEALDDRVDVGSEARIVWRGYYVYDGEPFLGNVTLSHPPVINEVGKVRYEVIAISDQLYGLTVFESNTVDVVFDMVVIELEASRSYYFIGEEVELRIRAYYAYDSTDFDGEVFLNNPLSPESVGEYLYTVERIVDNKYGLSRFTSNQVSIVFDNIVVRYSIDNSIPFVTRLMVEVYSEYLQDNVNATVYINGEKVNPDPENYNYVREFINLLPISTYNVKAVYKGVEVGNLEVDSTSYSTIALYIFIGITAVTILYKFGVLGRFSES